VFACPFVIVQVVLYMYLIILVITCLVALVNQRVLQSGY